MTEDNRQTPNPLDNNISCGSCCSCGTGSSGFRWLIIAIVIALGIAFFSGAFETQNNSPAVTWNHDYPTALKEAQATNKPLLLAFHAEWCPPCKKMKQSTYHDPAVIAEAKKFIPVMIDVDQQKGLAEKFAIQSIPAYRIVKPDGTVIAGFEGYHSAQDFIRALNLSLTKSQ